MASATISFPSHDLKTKNGARTRMSPECHSLIDCSKRNGKVLTYCGCCCVFVHSFVSVLNVIDGLADLLFDIISRDS